MGKGNIAVNQWIGRKERFADLFNGVVFHGKQEILPDELEKIPGESGIIVSDKEGKKEDTQRYRDVVMRWRKGIHLAVLACENQDKIHYAMPVRNMLYDSLTYTEQVKRTWKADNKTERKISSEEFLSRFRKDDKIYPVVTLVLYYDTKRWDGSTDLYGMFGGPFDEEEKNLMKKYIPNYHINLVEAGNIEDLEDLEVFKSDLQVIFGMLKYRENTKELKQYIYEHEEYFRQMDIETYRAAEALLHSENILEKNIGEEEDVNMCKALEGIYQEGIEQGLNIAAEILKDMGLLNEEISQRLSEKLPQNVEKE